MAEFVTNIALLVALLVLLILASALTVRRRHDDRRRHEQQRRLLTALLDHPATTPGRATPHDANANLLDPTPVNGPPLDAASLIDLLSLLEDRQPRDRRGLLARLATSPRSVWTAASAAGQRAGWRVVGAPAGKAIGKMVGAEPYRAAAPDPVNIHAAQAPRHTDGTSTMPPSPPAPPAGESEPHERRDSPADRG
jgi:hypothetical protein